MWFSRSGVDQIWPQEDAAGVLPGHHVFCDGKLVLQDLLDVRHHEIPHRSGHSRDQHHICCSEWVLLSDLHKNSSVINDSLVSITVYNYVPLFSFLQGMKHGYPYLIHGFSNAWFCWPGCCVSSPSADVEWCGVENRTFAGVIGSIDWTIGSMILCGVAYFINEWRVLIVAVTSPLILSVITWWWVAFNNRIHAIPFFGNDIKHRPGLCFMAMLFQSYWPKVIPHTVKPSPVGSWSLTREEFIGLLLHKWMLYLNYYSFNIDW